MAKCRRRPTTTGKQRKPSQGGSVVLPPPPKPDTQLVRDPAAFPINCGTGESRIAVVCRGSVTFQQRMWLEELFGLDGVKEDVR